MNSKRVRDFMARHYAKLKPNESLAGAVKTLLDYKQSAAPVIDDNERLIGILSEADCMRATLVEGYFNQGVSFVRELMTDTPEVLSPEVELSEVSSIFLQNNRRMMPIVEEGILVGIVSREDILKALVREKDGQLHPDWQPAKKN